MSNYTIGVVVDTETTGLSHKDELIEIAILLFSFDPETGQLIQIVDEYHGLRSPNGSISQSATAVHGLTIRDLHSQRLDDNRILTMFNQAEYIFAHNASFDRRYITKLFPMADQKKWCCTMNGISWKKMGFETRALQPLLNAHGIVPEQAHCALSDTKALLQLTCCTDPKTGKPYLLTLISTQEHPVRRNRQGHIRKVPVNVAAPKISVETKFNQFSGVTKKPNWVLVISSLLLLTCFGCVILQTLYN